MAARRKGRILAFQALFWWDAVRGSPAEVPVEALLDFPWMDYVKLVQYGEGTLAFSRLLVAGTIENIDAIDAAIKSKLQNWDFSRLKKADLAVLRISVYSLLFQKDIARSIVIEEAVGLCMEFSDKDSYKFVNGILDQIGEK
jgi:N utilization substance protein B